MPALGVEFRDVVYRAAERVVLDRVSFRVEPGETLVLLGRSGSGKTTALRLINGLLSASEGVVRVGDRELGEWDLIALRRQTGYVIQESGLFPHFTVRRNVALLPALLKWPAERARARADKLLNQMGLAPEEFGDRLPRQLSGGQRQRVGVARAIAADPGLLLLDEPFGALDPVTRLELQRQFMDLRTRSGCTSVFVTHDVREALTLASRIGLLNRGRLEFLGTKQQFLDAKPEEVIRFREVLSA